MFEIGTIGMILGLAIVPLLFGLILGVAFFFRSVDSIKHRGTAAHPAPVARNQKSYCTPSSEAESPFGA